MGNSILEVSGIANIIATVIVKKGDSFLMVQEKRPEVYGLWNFLSGKAELGEDILEAARREAKEEGGLDIDIVALSQVAYEKWQDGTGISVRFIFWGQVAESAAGQELSTDVLNVAWQTEDDLRELVEAKQLRNSYTYVLADLALEGKRYPLDIVHGYLGDINYR